MRSRRYFLNIALIVSVLVSAPGAVRAEKKMHVGEPKERTMAVTANPLQLLFLTGSFKYSVRVADHVALTIPLQTTYVNSAFQSSFFTDFSSSYWWIETGLGARFFLTDHAFKTGIYIEPELKVGFSQFGLGSAARTSILSITPGLMAGYVWSFDTGLYIGLGGGVSYNIKLATLLGSNTVLPGRFRYPWPILDASIGYSW